MLPKTTKTTYATSTRATLTTYSVFRKKRQMYFLQNFKKIASYPLIFGKLLVK